MYNNFVLKKNEIIKVGEYKYVVYKLGKISVDLLPIDEMLAGTKTGSIIPIIKIKKDLIKKHQKLDNYELLWLVNQKNPLIKEVIEDFLKKIEGKR